MFSPTITTFANLAPPWNLATLDTNFAALAAQMANAASWAAAGGSADAITATYVPANLSLTDGLLLGFRATAANATTTPTFAPDGLTAHTITKRGGAALVAGDIAGALSETLVRYNLANTRWELMNPSGNVIASVTNSLAADVNLNNTANWFDGPSCAQGTAGTWFASGTVCFTDTAGTANYIVRLWDGTTIVAGCFSVSTGASGLGVAALSGIITSPAANIRISVRDSTSASGKIQSNPSGTSGNKESTLTVIRLA